MLFETVASFMGREREGGRKGSRERGERQREESRAQDLLP